MGQESHYTSANLGGIKRSDNEEGAGDLTAQPTATADRAGSGASGGNSGASGRITGDASAGGAGYGETPLKGDSELDDLTVKNASDPSLGLTGLDDVPADDWAADTGPTVSTELKSPHHKL